MCFKKYFTCLSLKCHSWWVLVGVAFPSSHLLCFLPIPFQLGIQPCFGLLLPIASLTFPVSVFLSLNYRPFLFAWLAFVSWGWRQKLPSECWYLATKPHGPTFQKTVILTNIHCSENLTSYRQKVFEKRVLRRIYRPGKEKVQATVQVMYSLQPNIIRVTEAWEVWEVHTTFVLRILREDTLGEN